MDPLEYMEEQIRKAYGSAQQEAVEAASTSAATEPFSQALVEGARCNVAADRYERNRSARQACLQANGTRCAICGFDFAEVYGPEFAGIVQVHHITPLSEIGREHQVDPMRDLIPVCPNCHVALHSKIDGTYAPEELRALMRRCDYQESEGR